MFLYKFSPISNGVNCECFSTDINNAVTYLMGANRYSGAFGISDNWVITFENGLEFIFDLHEVKEGLIEN